MAEEEKLLKEAEDLPWKDRIMHENPNVRRQANIDLAVIFSAADAQDPDLQQFGPFFKDTVADSNASVQMVALKALTAYLNHVDSGVALRYAAEICDAIVANCLTGGLEMVEKSQAVFMRWVQLGAMEVFLDAMEKALKNKLCEAVVPMIDTMGKALRIFGAMKVPTKRILKMMAELFDHEDVNVRTSSKVLTLELYEGIEIEPMKSMEKDLEGELVSLTGTPGPSHRIRSEEDKEPEREGVSEVEGGSGSKESVTDAPPAIDDAVKILDTWKNKKFGDGVKAAELAKLASTDGMAPGDFKEIRSTLKEIMTCVVEHFGLRTTFVVEEGIDGFHIRSNDRSLPKMPITFNIHTLGEGAMIGKFLHDMGELIGWYNFIIGEEHLSMLIVPRIPSTPVIEEFKAWGESDVFLLDPLTTKATTIAPKFKILLRKIRSPMHKVLSQFGRYHGNVFQGLRLTNSGEVLLCLPDQSYDGANGVLKDIRELRALIEKVITSCQKRVTNPEDFPEDVKCFFFLCDLLESDISGAVGLDPKVIWDYAYYIMHSPIFMVDNDMCNFFHKLWSARGLDEQSFDAVFDLVVPNWRPRFNAVQHLSPAAARTPQTPPTPGGVSTSTSTLFGMSPLARPPLTVTSMSATSLTQPAPPLQQPPSATLSASTSASVPPQPTSTLQQPPSATLSASTSASVPPQPTSTLQQPPSTSLRASARTYVPPQPTPTHQRPSSSALSASARAFVPPQPTPTHQQPSPSALSASARAFVPFQPTLTHQQPSSSALSASARAFVPFQPTLTHQQPSSSALSASARAFVPFQPTLTHQQPSSSALSALATGFVPPQPTPPLPPPSPAQIPIDSHGLWFLRASRNTLAHHHQNVRKATQTVGEDELNAIQLIQGAVPEGVPLLYKWMVKKLRGPAPTSLTLFPFPLRYVFNSDPYNLCVSCAQRWQ